MTGKDKIGYWGLKGVVAVLGVIPFSAFPYLGNLFGRIWFSLDRKHKALAVANIRQAYGPEMSGKEAVALAEAVFKNFARLVFEHAWFNRLPMDAYGKFFRLKGAVHIKTAHSKGKGIIGISAHLGNWEVGLAANWLSGLPFCAVYKKIKNRGVNRYVLEKRGFTGFELIQTHGAFREVREYLAKGYVAGLLIDQNVLLRKGVFVDFFGRPACTNKSVARLALDTGAPVVPIFVYRESGRFVIECLPEVPVVRTGDRNRDIRENTQRFTKTVEDFVRKYPDQWFWLHNRWRTRPVSESKDAARPASTPLHKAGGL